MSGRPTFEDMRVETCGAEVRLVFLADRRSTPSGSRGTWRQKSRRRGSAETLRME